MRRTVIQTSRTLTFLIAAMLAAGPALADKPSWAGGGKNGKQEQEDRRDVRRQDRDERRDRDGGQIRDRDEKRYRDGRQVREREHLRPGVSVYFGDRHRTLANDYYVGQFRSGHCPPGLAKKGNGCMPPGQAKKWQIGRPLPHGVIYYDLPPALVIELGPPPGGYRFVRVASDILLIAVGTGMVIDAIEDLGRM